MKEDDKPIIDLAEDDYLVGIWCVGIPPQAVVPYGGDVMFTLFRHGPEGTPWTQIVRMRFYHPEDRLIVDGTARDHKIAHHFTLSGTQAEAEAKCVVDVLATMARFGTPEAELANAFLRVQGPHKKMLLLCLDGKVPNWAHLTGPKLTGPELKKLRDYVKNHPVNKP